MGFPELPIEPPEYDPPNVRCPMCGRRLNGETVYADRKNGEIFGCEFCVKELDWDEYYYECLVEDWEG